MSKIIVLIIASILLMGCGASNSEMKQDLAQFGLTNCQKVKGEGLTVGMALCKGVPLKGERCDVLYNVDAGQYYHHKTLDCVKVKND